MRGAAIEGDARMAGSLKGIERRFRIGRRALLSRLMAGRRARGLVASALDPSVVEVTRDMGDHRVTFDPRDLIGRHLFTRGDWGRTETLRVVELMDTHAQWRPGARTLVELGANIGTQTLYLSLTGRFDRVLAVEADPDNAAMLTRNVAQNGLGETVAIAAEAVGAEAGTARLARFPLNRGGNSLVRGSEWERGADTIEVPMRRIEAIMADHGIEPREVALTWIDVEGFEAELVPALGPLLECGAPVFMEWTPGEYGDAPARALLDLLARTHPRTVAFGLPRGGETEIATRDVPMDVKQLDLFAFAPAPSS